MSKQEAIQEAIRILSVYRQHKEYLRLAKDEKQIMNEREECRTYAVDFLLTLEPFMDEIAQDAQTPSVQQPVI